MADSQFGVFFSCSSDIMKAPNVAICTFKMLWDLFYVSIFKMLLALFYLYHEGRLKTTGFNFTVWKRTSCTTSIYEKIEQLLLNFDVHKASSKHILNLNDNLMVLKPKHKNVEGKYKVKKTSEKCEYQAQYAQTKCFRLISLLSYSKLESLSL